MRVLKLAGGVIRSVCGRVLWAQSLIRVTRLADAVISAVARVILPQGLMRVIKLTDGVIEGVDGRPHNDFNYPLGILLMLCLMAVLIAFTSRGVRRQQRNYFMTPEAAACDEGDLMVL